MASHFHELDDDPIDENVPLLSQSRWSSSQFYTPFFRQTSNPRTIILLLCLIIFLLSFAGHLIGVPAVRVYEDIICHHYYEDRKGESHIGLEKDIDESLCKVDEVQNQLNILLAGLQFLGAIPGILTTVPYGVFADRIGRRPVFLLSVCGMVLAGIYNYTIMYYWRITPVRLVWLSPFFTFIGGGHAVCSMMFYAIGSDVTTDQNRANVFLIGASATFVAELISPSLTSVLMAKYSPWVPLLSGMGLLIIGILPAFFISETLHLRRSKAIRSGVSTPASEPDTSTIPLLTALKAQMTDGLTRIYESTSILRSLPVLLLLIPFITSAFSVDAIGLSLRYVSQRFFWKLSQTLVLLSLRALINLVLFLAIIPGVSYYLVERLNFSSKQKDLLIARVSGALLVIGFLLMAFGPTISFTISGLAIVTLGTGFVTLVRSLITTLVDKEHVARLYGAVALVEISSALVASPTLVGMYALGLKWKGPWLGLPFFGVAIICFVGGLGVWCFGLLKKPQDGIPYSDEDRDTLVRNTLTLEEVAAEAGIVDVV